MANNEYENGILKWRQEVDNNLRRENGWLALAGLFWLRKGTNVIGAILDEPMQGYVSFKLDGKKHGLIVEELPDRRLFIQFMDLTNSDQTYPSGRYHYTDAHENGNVVVDFNKAYSPPCAFTEFATCTFPPQENHLNVAIEAGETYPGHC